MVDLLHEIDEHCLVSESVFRDPCEVCQSSLMAQCEGKKFSGCDGAINNEVVVLAAIETEQSVTKCIDQVSFRSLLSGI